MSPTTTRSLLLKLGPVTLELFDPLGRLVKELIPGSWMGTREHKLTWEAGYLKSGIYLLKLVDNDCQLTVKYFLIR
jgi:hypothetical protein